uniref:Large ribosomal subunit protein uL23m n=1 Tax=Buteo japonicus TaxID=224669 RepID=A0A8B9Z4F1_9AVES
MLSLCFCAVKLPWLKGEDVLTPEYQPVYKYSGSVLFYLNIYTSPSFFNQNVFALPRMTKVDIKNYLEKIYNVPVAAVRTRIQYGANNKRNHKNQRVKKPDYKVAYVQLGQGQTFEFPNLFPEKEQDTETRSFDDFKNKYMEREKQRQKGDPRRGGVPDWFGL